MLTLVTRPEPQASAWALDLQRQGVPAASLPLMAIGPPPDPASVHHAWQQLDRWRCVMIVSPNAAHWFAQLRPDLTRWPASLRSSSVAAERKAVKPSSGNLASITRPRPSPGRVTRQSGRLPFFSVG